MREDEASQEKRRGDERRIKGGGEKSKEGERSLEERRG